MPATTKRNDYGRGMTAKQKNKRPGKDAGMSKVKLAVGAASLFLFIIGVKRTFQMEGAGEPPNQAEPGAEPDVDAMRRDRPERRSTPKPLS